MNTLQTRARAALWWLVPLGVLLLLIGWETEWGSAMRKVPPPEDAIAPRPVVTSLLPEYAIAGGTAARSETVQRTLFNPTRRPAATLAADPSKQRLQRGQFALTGTTVVEGKNTAFLRETAGGKSRRVKQGETINGIVVAEVKPDRVRLALGDESEELVLRVATNPRPTAPPAPAGAAPNPAPAVPGGAPAAPAAGQPAQPAAAGSTPSLAERRRAARAAQGGVAEGGVNPAAAATSAPTAQPSPTAAPAATATGTAPDPRWADVYRRYQTPAGRSPP